MVLKIRPRAYQNGVYEKHLTYRKRGGSDKITDVRDDEIRSRLREQNPWWRAVATSGDPIAWIQTDPTLRSRSAFDLGYRSNLLDDVATDRIDDKLIILHGPRRIGKSVLLKDTIAALCGRTDIDPRQVIYLPTDGMRAGDLNRVAKLGRELTRSVGEAPRAWLLDEVTGIAGWTETLKYLRDNTEFGRDTVVCTGSSWDENAQVERDLLAGRAGSTSTRRSRLLHPMSFRAVLTVTGRELPLPVTIPPWALQDAETRAVVESLELFVDEFDLAWQAYVTSGGFPRAVAEHHRNGAVSDAFLHDLAAWLHRDVDPSAAEDSVGRLLAEVHARSTAPLNRNDMSQALGYANRQTFDVRLNRLVRTFAAIWCHQVDEAGRRVAGAQSKLYLADPILTWLGPQIRSGLLAPDFSYLTEACLGVALAQAIDATDPGRWLANDSIGYLRTGSGNEVDFAPIPARGPSGPMMTTPIEAKWVTTNWRSEARTIEGKFARGVVATRTITDLQHPSWAVPAPLVALLLA
jgi:predicted AAA+ superfamily ATPase